MKVCVSRKIYAIFWTLAVLLYLWFLPGTNAQVKCTKSGAKASLGSKTCSQEFLDRKKNLLQGSCIGYRVVKFTDKLKMAIWYPSKSKEASYDYKIGDTKVSSKLAVNGAVKDGIFPVVFYAHGAVGCGLSSFFLTEAIARKGYIVAAPDFSDEVYASRIDELVPTSKKKTKEIWNYLYSLRDNGLDDKAESGRSKFDYRPKELRLAMDFLLNLNGDSGSIFFKHLETEKIAIVGHSFGAWTAALVSGADPRYSKAGIGALVYLSGPSNNNVFRVISENDLAKIHCPVMFQYGAKEKLFSERQDDRYLYSRANSPKVLACIADCNHFTFSCGSAKQFSTASDYISKSIPRVVICDLVIGFFDKFLKSSDLASSYIREKTPGVEIFKSNLGIQIEKESRN